MSQRMELVTAAGYLGVRAMEQADKQFKSMKGCACSTVSKTEQLCLPFDGKHIAGGSMP